MLLPHTPVSHTDTYCVKKINVRAQLKSQLLATTQTVKKDIEVVEKNVMKNKFSNALGAEKKNKIYASAKIKKETYQNKLKTAEHLAALHVTVAAGAIMKTVSEERTKKITAKVLRASLRRKSSPTTPRVLRLYHVCSRVFSSSPSGPRVAGCTIIPLYNCLTDRCPHSKAIDPTLHTAALSHTITVGTTPNYSRSRLIAHVRNVRGQCKGCSVQCNTRSMLWVNLKKSDFFLGQV